MGIADAKKFVDTVNDHISPFKDALYFSASPENLEFFQESLGLEVSVTEDGENFIEGSEAKEKFGSLLPAVAGDMPWGESSYLENEEIDYLKKLLKNIGIHNYNSEDSKKKLGGLKTFLQHPCWGKQEAFSNLFRREFMGSAYMNNESQWIMGNVFGTAQVENNDPEIMPYKECLYNDIPKEFIYFSPILVHAPVPLSAVKDFSCPDIDLSVVQVSYIHDVCNPGDPDLTAGSAIVVDTQKGLLLTVRHLLGKPLSGVTQLIFKGSGGNFEVPLEEVKAVMSDEESDWMILQLDDPGLLEGYKNLPLADKSDQLKGGDHHFAVGFGYFKEGGTGEHIFSAVETWYLGEDFFFGELVSGMSGGPIITPSCELVAINKSYKLGRFGVSRATPISTSDIEELLKKGLQPVDEIIQWEQLQCE